MTEMLPHWIIQVEKKHLYAFAMVNTMEQFLNGTKKETFGKRLNTIEEYSWLLP
jgi:hypothetical protein